MEKVRHEPTVPPREATQREETQREEAGTSVVRRVLMFPLTRVLIGGAIFLVLSQLLVGVAVSLLGIEFLEAHKSLVKWIAAVLPAVAAFAFVGKVIERRSLADNGLGRRGLIGGNAWGFVLGAGMMSAVIGVLALAGWYDVTGVEWSRPGVWTAALGALGLFLAASVFEEVLFRGIFFRIIEEGLGSWIALAITALFFGYVHLANPNGTLLGGLGVALAGVLLAAAYMMTRSLWLPIGLHWGWGFVEPIVFGMRNSGFTFEGGLVRAATSGPELWTGGAFGPEAGLVAYIVITLVTAGMLFVAVRRGHIVTPRWMRLGMGKKAARV